MSNEVQCCSCFGWFGKEFMAFDEFLPEENHYESICINCNGGEVWDDVVIISADLFESVDDAQGQRDDPFANAVSAIDVDWDDLPF